MMNIPDRFLHFTYNGIHSSEFGVFYTNYGEDLFFPFALNYKHNIQSPLYQSYSYLLGSSPEANTFSLDLATDGQTVYSTTEIFDWLSPDEPGELIFDYMPNYKYPVIISKISNPTVIPREHPNGYIESIVTFRIEFVTYKDYIAQTVKEYQFAKNEDYTLLEPDSKQLVMIKKGNKMSFYNFASSNQSFTADLAGKDVLVTSRDNDSQNIQYKYNLKSTTTTRLYSETGAIVTQDKLIEAVYPHEEIINNGPLLIKPATIFSGAIEIKQSGSNLEIDLNERFKSIGTPSSIALVTEMKLDKNSKTVYEDGSKGGDKGVYPQNKNDHPIYLIGTYQSGKLVFPNHTSNPLRPGVHKVKIATSQDIEITADEYRVYYNHKKGV